MPQRYVIVGITAVAALLMYIDRVCISILADPIQTDLGLSDREKARALGAFFFTYALFQIPMGSLADRFGARLVLAGSIAAWSAVTGLTGFVTGFATLLVARLCLGLAEAGAYPAAAGLVKRWALPEERGRFSSGVALGGRVGGAVAPTLTRWIAIGLAGVGAWTWAANPSGVNWRSAFVVYALAGLVIALVFWLMVRDHPPVKPDHEPPIGPSPAEPPAENGAKPPATLLRRLRVIATTRTMWLFGGVQFCNNVSWAFLVTLLPTFLKDANIEIGLRSDIQTGVLFAGCVGTLLGGFATDAVRRRLGPRWSRAAPIAAMMTLCAVMCGVVSSSPGLWVAVGALAMMSMCQDIGIPSVWAYAQDVGGKNVGAALGWGNMLGNFGAALSPVLLTEVQLVGGWEASFALCAGCYLVAATCGLMLDATRPLDPDEKPGA